MTKLGGVIGAVLAISILFVFTEWLYVDWVSRNVGDVIGTVFAFVIAAGGWLVGSRVARRLTVR